MPRSILKSSKLFWRLNLHLSAKSHSENEGWVCHLWRLQEGDGVSSVSGYERMYTFPNDVPTVLRKIAEMWTWAKAMGRHQVSGMRCSAPVPRPTKVRRRRDAEEAGHSDNTTCHSRWAQLSMGMSLSSISTLIIAANLTFFYLVFVWLGFRPASRGRQWRANYEMQLMRQLDLF